ncbi:MAG: hypothetical protein ACOX8T_10875 [Bacillota bacterium]|jgi:hypothetical protein
MKKSIQIELEDYELKQVEEFRRTINAPSCEIMLSAMVKAFVKQMNRDFKEGRFTPPASVKLEQVAIDTETR